MVLVVRLLLAIVFAAAIIGKAGHLGLFVGSLRALGFPRSIARSLAPVIAYEALLVGLLAIGLVPLLTAAMVVALLVVFFVVSMAAHVKRRVIPCNCFGRGDATLGPSTAARSVLLLIVAVTYAWLSLSDRSPIASFPIASSLATTVLVASLTAALLLCGRWILSSAQVIRLMIDRHDVQALTALGVKAD
jgi:hypothetical protein